MQENGKQFIRVGKTRVELPPGVTVADWALERSRSQNPRIRSYLGCIRIIEEMQDSNYAILHCSPARLFKIWQRVRRVCQQIATDIGPTLEQRSIFPNLDSALRSAEAAFGELARNVLDCIKKYPDHYTSDQAPEVRKVLCISIGKIYSFPKETLGEVLAGDPRSQHDSDYFLSRRFAHEIEESEWLYSSVYELNESQAHS